MKSLGDLCKMQAGKFVSASEINEKPNADLFPCYGGNGLRGYTKSFNHDGQYSLIGRQGALCGNVTLADGKFYATEHAVVVTPNNDMDIAWMFYLLTYSNLNQYATGQAQPGLSVQNLEKVEATIPTSKQEQQKIATFLSIIDEKISTQSKIIEGLAALKAALSKKIFSRQFRFLEFDEDWKAIKLEEVLTIPEKIKPVRVDRDKLITVKLHLKGVLQNENAETLSLGATNYFVRRKGQFIYGKQNLFNGAFGLVPDELDGFLSSADVPALEVNRSKMNASYFLYFLGREDFYKRLEDIATGSVRWLELHGHKILLG